ncbi:DUF4221 family protein [Algoriphagus resistens]|uniref:DUF4221 family protein n=1 Tax=Algoriphagus resistens TaxID=1750590 RepID=UPI000716B15A|nr:DUF4221 family protein [Algoriphagus resistens]
MRLVVAVASFLIVCSCASKEQKKKTVSDQISVSLDTVMIDAGDEFLYLQDQLYSSSLAADKNVLFNFNYKEYKLEKIDLNRLRLEQLTKFEKEGPDGIGSTYPKFKVLSDQNLLWWTYSFYKIFDQKGQFIRDLELDKIADGYLEGYESYLMDLFLDQSNSERVIGLIKHWQSGKSFFLDFDLANQTFKKIDLPELDKISDYTVKLLSDGRPAGGYGGSVYSVQASDKILLSTNTFNEVQVFDLTTDSLYHKAWDTSLLGYRRTYLPPKSVEHSSGELKEIVRKSEEDISYKAFFWDQKSERFLRFSERKHFGEELTDYGSYVAIGADVFLSIYDKELNLISEAIIPELTQSPKVHFAKDGNIWMFENIADELAFVIIKVGDIGA